MLKRLPHPGHGLGDKIPQYIVGMALTLAMVLWILWYVDFVFAEASRARILPAGADQREVEASVIP